MAMTKLSTSGGPTGIPNPDPVSTDQGGPEGVGGSNNTVNPARVKATEPAGSGTPGAGANGDLFSPWHDGKGQPATSGGGGSNVDRPPATHSVTGTALPSGTGAGKGTIRRGGRGGK